MCKLIERPSKKDGFCFKLYHPLDQSIWAPKGPLGETIRKPTFFLYPAFPFSDAKNNLNIFFLSLLAAPIQPLPTSHLIFRVSSQGAGKCWMDALELALKCSSLLIRSMSTRSASAVGAEGSTGQAQHVATSTGGELQWNESDFEKHFRDHGTLS